MRVLWSRLVALFRGRKEMEQELGEHVALLEEEFIRRGMTPQAARAAAGQRFGRITAVREDLYERAGLPLVETVFQDLRTGWRSMRADRAFSLQAIVVLALGIGLSTAVFTLVDALLLNQLPYRDADRIVLLNRLPAISFQQSRSVFGSWRRDHPMIENAALYTPTEANLFDAGEPAHVSVAQVSAEFPSVMGAARESGRAFASDEDMPGRNGVALISNRLWMAQFGSDPRIIGRRIRVNDRRLTIIGVMPRGFDYPPGTGLWTPSAYTQDFSRGNVRFVHVVARMARGVSAAALTSALKAELVRSDPNAGRDFVTINGFRFEQPAIVAPLKKELSGSLRKPVLVLFGAVLFVLLIACTNVSTLVLSRAASREREFAVRHALGAGAARLVQHAITEHVLLGVIGGACGTLLTFWSVAGLKALLPADWPGYAALHVDVRVLGFAILTSLVAGLAAGLLPALRVAGRGPIQSDLSRGSRATESAGTARLRRTMVLIQTALAMTLLVGAGLMLRGLLHLIGEGPGFRTDHLLAVSVSRRAGQSKADAAATSAFYSDVLAGLRASPSVTSAGGIDNLPLAGASVMIVFAKASSGRQVEVVPSRVAPGYFRTMGIPLLAGRDFDDHDAGDGTAILNELAAKKLWPGDDPIGRRVDYGDREFTVIGVTTPVSDTGSIEQRWPQIYLPYASAPPDFFSFVMRTSGEPEAAISAAKAAIRRADPNEPIDRISTMDEYLSRTLQKPRSLTGTLAVFSTVGFLLALIGIYGVIAYSVSHRGRELGIRMALGAQARRLIREAVSGTMGYVLAGVALGIGGAVACGRVLESQMEGLKSTDPIVLGGLAAAVLITSACAGLVAARRIASLDPNLVLRVE